MPPQRRAGRARERAHVGKIGARLPAPARPGAARPCLALARLRADGGGCSPPAGTGRAPRRSHRQPEVRHRARTWRSRPRGRAWRARLARPVLLLASTREGEEKLLLEALPAWDGALLVLVVPRHAAALRRGCRTFAVAPQPQPRTPRRNDRVHLGDSMGEMDFYYAAADVAVIGGSFVPRGGQNLIEACAAGVPVVFGPSMFNFSEAARLAVAAGAARAGRRRGGGNAGGRRACWPMHARERQWERRAGNSARRIAARRDGTWTSAANCSGLQGAVDHFEVLLVQAARRRLQPQVVHDGSVARDQQVAAGRIHLLLARSGRRC